MGPGKPTTVSQAGAATAPCLPQPQPLPPSAHSHTLPHRAPPSYIPSVGDPVVGTITDRHPDTYTVDIGAPFRALLPALAFEGATRRNRPNLKARGAALRCATL